MNCWEYKNCGRDVQGGCPAYIEGKGRICWLVAGTMCGGEVQGTFARKIKNCNECDFFKMVRRKHEVTPLTGLVKESWKEGSENTRPTKILIVDDESQFLFAVSFTLRMAGFKTAICGNGTDALRLLRKFPGSFDLLLLDLQMPGLTGFELLAEVDKDRLMIPTLVVSGYATASQIKQLTGNGERAFLEKPFEPCRLLEEVRSMLH